MERVIKELKAGKARDDRDWNNELILDGGEEMVASLIKIADLVKEQLKVPNQWQTMGIKSVHKKGKLADLRNKRGLFLTNIVSKTFEKIQEKESCSTFDKLQNGGTTDRSTSDNWMILNAVLDEGRRLKKPVYLFFADLVKCFDRLWLKDCLVDLKECGMRDRDVVMIYRLNEEAVFKVHTPAGDTEAIVVNEVVKQGTVFGSKLCCASTGKVNEGLKIEEILYPSVHLKAVIFVDDINGIGGKGFVEGVMERCKEKEDEKLWEFSTDKSNWMCVTNRKRKTDNIEVSVKQGRIEKAEKYKYLGNMVNEKGNMDDQLIHMERKVNAVVRETNKICSPGKVGKYEFEGKKLMYDSQIVPSIYFNIEAWTNMRKADVEKLKSIQGQLIRRIFGLPKCTPYIGMLFEMEITPIMKQLLYKKLMLFHNFIHSDDRRVAKQ